MTISQFNVPSDDARITWAVIASAAVGVAVGALVSKAASGPRSGSYRPFSRHVVAVTTVAQGIAGILVAWILVYYGLRYGWRLPDLRLGLPTFWAMYAAGFAALTAVVLVGISWLLSPPAKHPPAEQARDRGEVESPEESPAEEGSSDAKETGAEPVAEKV